jgi:alpha-tubulin suppressor-like RCC1 family protein
MHESRRLFVWGIAQQVPPAPGFRTVAEKADYESIPLSNAPPTCGFDPVDVVAGWEHSVAMDADGGVWTWVKRHTAIR